MKYLLPEHFAGTLSETNEPVRFLPHAPVSEPLRSQSTWKALPGLLPRVICGILGCALLTLQPVFVQAVTINSAWDYEQYQKDKAEESDAQNTSTDPETGSDEQSASADTGADGNVQNSGSPEAPQETDASEAVADTSPDSRVYTEPDIIKNVQFLLNAFGYGAGAVDGVWGTATQNALTAYQQANGLPQTGQITQDVLESLLSVQSRVIPAFFQSPEFIRAASHADAENASSDLVIFDKPDERFEKKAAKKKAVKSVTITAEDMDRDAFKGQWVLFTGPDDPAGFEIRLPSAWALTASYAENRSYQIAYEPEKPLADGIDLFTIQLIPAGRTAERALENLRNITGIYEKYDFENTAAVQADIMDFSGVSFIVVEEAEEMDTSTCSFAGSNAAGDVLVVGVSSVLSFEDTEPFIRQLLGSIRAVDKADRDSTDAAPVRVTPSPVPLPTFTPTPSPTPIPTPSPMPESWQDFYDELQDAIETGNGYTEEPLPQDETATDLQSDWSDEQDYEDGDYVIITTTTTTVEEFTSEP